MLEALVEARTGTLKRIEDIAAEIEDVVRASDGANADDEHDPEGSTIAFERARATSLLMQAENDLVALDRAIGRLHEGRFGACEVCGRAIPVERFTALPSTTMCVQCARAR